MVVGVMRVELHVPDAQSLKDKRSAVKSVKEQLRGRFNVAVAEVEANDTWQRATLGVVTVSEGRAYAEGLLRQAAEWIRSTGLVAVIRIDEEFM